MFISTSILIYSHLVIAQLLNNGNYCTLGMYHTFILTMRTCGLSQSLPIIDFLLSLVVSYLWVPRLSQGLLNLGFTPFIFQGSAQIICSLIPQAKLLTTPQDRVFTELKNKVSLYFNLKIRTQKPMEIYIYFQNFLN